MENGFSVGQPSADQVVTTGQLAGRDFPTTLAGY